SPWMTSPLRGAVCQGVISRTLDCGLVDHSLAAPQARPGASRSRAAKGRSGILVLRAVMSGLPTGKSNLSGCRRNFRPLYDFLTIRVPFTNLGCKLNQAEIERLGRGFEAAGHEVVGSLAEADVHVVNSCTVTHVAARESRKAAGRARRSGRPVRTVLTGCYTTGSPAGAAPPAGGRARGPH